MTNEEREKALKLLKDSVEFHLEARRKDALHKQWREDNEGEAQ